MNPKNGEILAYAVYPTYDPNNYKNATQAQIKNWTLTDVFPPGSTFKIITVASAMELGKINEHSTVLDTGKTTIGNWEIKNYDYDVHPYPGHISLEYLFEHSSNIGAINIARTMTPKEFYDMLKNSDLVPKQVLICLGSLQGFCLTTATGTRGYLLQCLMDMEHLLLLCK